jgi:hypothetical protein
LKVDPGARWHATEYSDEHGCARPCMYLPDGSAMVKTEVTIKGETKVCLLPVMDHRNKAIKNPDAFAINTAIMRCMTKTISMHGLGLYIYAGEDLPEGEEPDKTHTFAANGKPLKESADGARTVIPEDRQHELDEMALNMVESHKHGQDMFAIAAYYGLTDNEEKIYIWYQLREESKLRALLKANAPLNGKGAQGEVYRTAER